MIVTKLLKAVFIIQLLIGFCCLLTAIVIGEVYLIKISIEFNLLFGITVAGFSLCLVSWGLLALFTCDDGDIPKDFFEWTNEELDDSKKAIKEVKNNLRKWKDMRKAANPKMPKQKLIL